MGNLSNIGMKILLPGHCSYTTNEIFKTYRSQIIYLNNEDQQQKMRPILRVESKVKNCTNNMIYFHGNNEDIGTSFSFMLDLSDSLNCNVYAIEYPGYGFYDKQSIQHPTTPEQMKHDALSLYEFLIEKQKVSPDTLIIAGRSMGSGPSSWLASNKNVSMLVLISPYQSIDKIVKDKVLFTYGLKNFFDNKSCLDKINCPITFIHGNKDWLINYHHSQELHNHFIQSKKISNFYLRPKMTHNDFDFKSDIANPIIQDIQSFVKIWSFEEKLTQQAISSSTLQDHSTSCQVATPNLEETNQNQLNLKHNNLQESLINNIKYKKNMNQAQYQIENKYTQTFQLLI